MEASTEKTKTEGSLILDGSECFNCHRICKGRATLWLYRRDPATGIRVRYKRHPKPKRYFACDCGRRWSKRIPKSSLVRGTKRPA